MKIVYIVGNLAGGGVQRVIENLSKVSKNRGINTEVLVLTDTNDNHLDFEEIDVRVLGGGSIKSSFKLLFLHLRSFDSDTVIITGQPHVNIFVLFMATISMSKARIFITEHNPIDIARTNKGKVIQKIKWIFYKFSTGIVCVSKSIEDQIHKTHPKFKYHPIRTIYNPVAVSLCNINTKSIFREKSDNPYVVTCIGRLHYQKNIGLAISAFSEFLKDNGDSFLKIVGNGEERSDLEDLAASCIPKDKYRFEGFCNDIGKVLDSTDCLLLTSRWEGFGIVIVEALLSGVNIVSTNCPGPVEILNNGEFGEIANSDPKSLALALRKIKTNPINANVLMKRGYVVSDPEIIFDQYLEFINTLN